MISKRLTGHSVMTGTKHANDNIKLGTVRPIDPSDPRSINHPCHKEQWLELARAIGRLEAREEYAMIHNSNERSTDGIAENRNRC
jgi:hypothetical protein